GRTHRQPDGKRRRQSARRQGNSRHAFAVHLHPQPPGKGRPMKSRYFRLLRGVVVLSTAVLALKTTDRLHGAYRRAGEKRRARLLTDPVPANKDFAGGDDDQVASASEVDVVNSLAKRRRELDARDAQLSTQANMIAAAEARVDAKINQLKQLQAQIN